MFWLQLDIIKDLTDQNKDQNSTGDSEDLSSTLKLVLESFNSICRRHTKLMATKYLLQHYIFNTSNATLVASLTRAVMHLQSATSRLQRIQVSTFYITMHA